tara:strand:+ start:493 stop:2145 length:1653 start_codon:yes stop_codon:yes gene_type:complete
MYIPFRDLDFLRFWRDTDLFNKYPYDSIIRLTLHHNGVNHDLAFNINRPKVIADSYLRVAKGNNQAFKDFAQAMKDNSIKLDEAIFLYETSPISRILGEEPYMTRGQVNRKIMLGKSQDVLRNKIVKHNHIGKLNEQVSEVMGSTFEFQHVNSSRQDNEEYIDLQVKHNGKQHELHMQGSGLLQVIEIFGTLDYAAAELNILLIDEPDSHIHLVLQKRLMKSLRDLADNQTFIISHNDAFVSECNNGELFYLNNEAKLQKELKALEDFDLVKKDFGSPILALQKLNEANHVVFVEGSDDIENIKLLLTKYQEAGIIPNTSQPADCQFFFIRGKDKLVDKLDHNKRTLSQLFKDKKYVIITDKDFTTLLDSQALNASIESRLRGNSIAFSHDGYCLESTLFSDLNLLYGYLAFVSGKTETEIRISSETYLEGLRGNLNSVSTAYYSTMKQKFISQKRNRGELANTEFDDVMADITQDIHSLKFIMNKGQIRKFIEHLEIDLNIVLVTPSPDDTDENYCASFFQDYCNSLSQHHITLQNHKILLNNVYDLNL